MAFWEGGSIPGGDLHWYTAWPGFFFHLAGFLGFVASFFVFLGTFFLSIFVLFSERTLLLVFY